MISIIMPVYKAEKYLNRAITSILNQTYTDFELLLIDDGSPDNSGALCDEWVQKDSRIKSLHKKNGGTSDARNFGIEKAQGDYITFIDCDDFVMKTWLDDMLTIAQDTNADIVKCGIYYVPEADVSNGNAVLDYNIAPFNTIRYEKEQISPYQFHLRLLNGNGYNAVWNQLVKTSIQKMCPFPTNHLNEDYNVFFSLLSYAQNIQISDCIGYCWGQRVESQSRYRSNEYIADMIDDFVRHHKIFKNFYDDDFHSQQALLGAVKNFFYGLASAERIDSTDPQLLDNVWKRLYAESKNSDVLSLLPPILKMQYIIYGKSANTYKKIMHLKKAILK